MSTNLPLDDDFRIESSMITSLGLESLTQSLVCMRPSRNSTTYLSGRFLYPACDSACQLMDALDIGIAYTIEIFQELFDDHRFAASCWPAQHGRNKMFTSRVTGGCATQEDAPNNPKITLVKFALPIRVYICLEAASIHDYYTTRLRHTNSTHHTRSTLPRRYNH